MAAQHRHTGGQQRFHPMGDLLKILGAAAETGGAEQKYFLIGQLGQKGGSIAVTGALVGPEADIQPLCGQGCRVRRAEIAAVLRRKDLPNGVGQGFGVAGAAAVNNGV